MYDLTVTEQAKLTTFRRAIMKQKHLLMHLGAKIAKHSELDYLGNQTSEEYQERIQELYNVAYNTLNYAVGLCNDILGEPIFDVWVWSRELKLYKYQSRSQIIMRLNQMKKSLYKNSEKLDKLTDDYKKARNIYYERNEIVDKLDEIHHEVFQIAAVQSISDIGGRLKYYNALTEDMDWD